MRNTAFFIAMLATGTALGPALAHLFELPNKIGMTEQAYFATQQAYRGWDRLAFVLIVELGAMIWTAVLYWGEPRVRWPVLGAIAGVLLAQAVFWTWTYPANVATQNWTAIPANWEQLRHRWEYSHAAGAVFQLLALASLTVGLLARSGQR
jgi:uncharacterized membrane protein